MGKRTKSSKTKLSTECVTSNIVMVFERSAPFPRLYGINCYCRDINYMLRWMPKKIEKCLDFMH